jgi:hypothetical protein
MKIDILKSIESPLVSIQLQRELKLKGFNPHLLWNSPALSLKQESK